MKKVNFNWRNNENLNVNSDIAIVERVAMILDLYGENQFEVDGESIIEYDLSEQEDPIYWNIVNINYYEDGSINDVDIDC